MGCPACTLSLLMLLPGRYSSAHRGCKQHDYGRAAHNVEVTSVLYALGQALGDSTQVDHDLAVALKAQAQELQPQSYTSDRFADGPHDRAAYLVVDHSNR